uniref:Uncharacterized protein n=1 Tax=Strigamia maritima TaxID=126957 RepID=T1IIB0_STRMM
MAELSIQGEDFARQMWQMYAIFEEFLNNHLGWNHSVTANVMPLSEEARFSSIQDQLPSMEPAMDSLSMGSPMKEMSSPKANSPEVCNPLLETIRIIQSLDAMDDCANSSEYCQQKSKIQDKGAVGDGDKDSIGYAGSNSVDSGYKSSCPTPDLSDGSCYGGEGKTASSSSLNRVPECKPRIAMGTRVMHRQHQYPYSSNRSANSSCQYDVSLDHLMNLRQTLVTAMQQCQSANDNDNDNDSQVLDERVKTPDYCRPKMKQNNTKLGTYQRSADHSHFLQCAALDAHSRRMPSPTLGSRQLRTPSPIPQRLRRVSSPSLSSWQHPRNQAADDDFNGLYGFRPYKSAQSEPSVADGFDPSARQFTPVTCVSRSVRTANSRSSDGNSGEVSQKTIRFNVDKDCNYQPSPRDVEGSPIKCKSKPILKDPICANLRAQLEQNHSDPSVPMLEEEIDTLLYGKTETCNVKQSNIPCSYVTMIEDKYRRSSVARVKKLRDRVSDANAHLVSNNIRMGNSLLLDEPLQMTTSKQESNNVDSSDMKSRFSEVACCMLEIIEDLQRQKLLSNTVTKVEETRSCPSSGVPKETTMQDKNPILSTSPSSSSSPVMPKELSGADYHVYEEIMYDLGIGHRQNSPKRGSIETKASVMPPPLPKRPDNGLRSVGSTVSNASQPKQRLNLYSLFQEQSDRRSISVSLEQEWRLEQESKTMDDEYGFKMGSSLNDKSNAKFF